jgi:predicted RND superfamily exporter protein
VSKAFSPGQRKRWPGPLFRHLRAFEFVAWALRYRRLLWAAALLLGIPALGRTAWLYGHLRSDLEELLPRDSPSVVALNELRDRVGAHQYLGVVVDAGSADRLPQAERFLDDLAARVGTYPPPLVSAVRTGDQVERAFLDRHGALYLDIEDLETMRGRIEARRDYEAERQTGALLDEDTQPPPLDFEDIKGRYETRLGIGHERGPGGRYTSVQQHLTVLVIELGQYSTGTSTAHRLLDSVKHDIASLGGLDHYARGMRLGFAGDAAISVEELSALVSDLSVSSVVVVVAVLGAIVIYYRWWTSLWIVGPPLLVATVGAFAIASLPPFGVTALNSNTAFLGSIIVGNGINFGLILLSRYVEERRRGRPVLASLEDAVEGSRGGTLAAAAAAAVSYGSLAITSFRGFRQFGYIGGLGMMLAWVSAFLLMPSLIFWFDRDESTRPKPRTENTRFSYWVAAVVRRAPWVVLAATTAITAVAVFQVAHFRLGADIESNFSRLRRRDTWSSGEGYWGKRMDSVLGQYLTPLAVLADNPDQARAVEARLVAQENQPPFAGRIESIRSIADVLPSSQDDKLEVLGSIREDLTPRVMASLAPDQRDYVTKLFLSDPRPITVDDLPPTFTLGLRERSGETGNIVLVYPQPGSDWWNGPAIAGFVGELRRVASESELGGQAPRVAGSLALSSDLAHAIMVDGARACAVALAGVVAMVVLLLRMRRATVYVITALLVGSLWLAGATHLLGIRINFANFIAFPITLGIGVDYAVNVVSRYELEGQRDVLHAVRTTGAAVALCSLTTIIGYSSLLMAQNRALFLFGLLAVLGEVACLSVALAGLPAFLLVLHGREHLPWTGPRSAPRRRLESFSPFFARTRSRPAGP